MDSFISQCGLSCLRKAMSSRRRPAEAEGAALEALGSRLQAVLRVSADLSSPADELQNNARVRCPPYLQDARCRHKKKCAPVPDEVLSALKMLLRKHGKSPSLPNFELKLERSFNVDILRNEFGWDAVSKAFALLAKEKGAAASAPKQAARRKARTPGRAPLENAVAGEVAAQKQPARPRSTV